MIPLDFAFIKMCEYFHPKYELFFSFLIKKKLKYISIFLPQIEVYERGYLDLIVMKKSFEFFLKKTVIQA
jgi:hypothetical protein